jgi:hypothetical protein
MSVTKSTGFVAGGGSWETSSAAEADKHKAEKRTTNNQQRTPNIQRAR